MLIMHLCNHRSSLRTRAVEAGDYRLFVGGGQPDTGAPGQSVALTIQGRAPLPK